MMPTTRKKVIKTIYKDDGSESEGGDFSDSGSDAKFSDAEESSSDETESSLALSSGNIQKSCKSSRPKRPCTARKPKLVKTIVQKINNQSFGDNENTDDPPPLFSVKDLTEADKLLPPILNLSESDSSDDEGPKPSSSRSFLPTATLPTIKDFDSESEANTEYKNVWSSNLQDNISEEIAKKTFMELEQHKSKIEEAKASLQSYTLKMASGGEKDVNDLLALGEEALPEEQIIPKKKKIKKKKNDSDSEIEDWEEVAESKTTIPQQGIQLFVEFPDMGRKKKKVDVEMMMKRKINRVKKEYQVYMHKVHVLCWLGHGNYVSCVLNDQELMAAALSLVPSKECYPGERVDMKYVEQVTMWYKDKLTLKQDKYEGKFRPKAPPLKSILLEQIKSRVVTTKKYSVFIFVSMLRALGLQCRIMFNFVTLPLKPPTTELCSLSLKEKGGNNAKSSINSEKSDVSNTKKKGVCNKISKTKLHQVDGHFDSDSENDIVQLDGNNDNDVTGSRKTRSTKRNNAAGDDPATKDILPSKIPRKRTSCNSPNLSENVIISSVRRTQRNKDKNTQEVESAVSNKIEGIDNSKVKINKTRSCPVPKPSEPVQKIKSDEDPNSYQRKRNTVSNKTENHPKDKLLNVKETNINEDVSPPKISRTRKSPKPTQKQNKTHKMETTPKDENTVAESASETKNKTDSSTSKLDGKLEITPATKENKKETLRKNERSKNAISKQSEKDVEGKVTIKNADNDTNSKTRNKSLKNIQNADVKPSTPQITVTNQETETSTFFANSTKSTEKLLRNKLRLSRNRSATANPNPISSGDTEKNNKPVPKPKRTKSAPGSAVEESKYFNRNTPKRVSRNTKDMEESNRVSHRDLAKGKSKAINDVTDDLVDIIKKRIKNAKEESKKGIVKGKIKKESDEDSDYLPVEDAKRQSGSDDDFKPTKISPKPSTSRKIDRRVLSSEDEIKSKKIVVDVWCEIFVEELEQWVSVDVIKGKMHDVNTFYANATHPVCYIVGWGNNNYLKDLTRKYVPHWNTVTRKQRVESAWWDTALKPWLGPKTAKDKEEDEYLDRMQLEAPLPKSIAEYKNHPLYALQRHLLKFEAIYPPDAAVLGFVRNEAVYARECVYVCRSRDTWLKEAKVVKLGEKPYKVVKARPKWDKLSNKMITDKPLEVFGPWQVQDYEPPVAENGMVPRNAYGNVELFKDCMLPKGTVHLKLPALNRVAKKLNIDCAPAMTGFDFNGGWSHPVYDGFVVCKEFEEIITDAWVKDQEEQERREREKIETRVYGNWKRLIKGLLIKERLKSKYGFEEPAPSQSKGKSKGPRLVVKKNM